MATSKSWLEPMTEGGAGGKGGIEGGGGGGGKRETPLVRTSRRTVVIRVLQFFILLQCLIVRQAAADRATNRIQPVLLSCPPEAELLPCKCQLRGQEIHVKCENSVLNKVVGSLEKLMKRVLTIEELHLVGNRIHVLPARVFGSLQVNKLFLINNELVGINRNAFAGLESSLQHLYITDPELYNVPFDALDNLANLRTCVLENTDITEIPRLYSLSKLEFLKIDGSRVTTIPTAAFRFMPNMKKVHIANSRLKEINGNALEGLVYLKEVNFSNNMIDWIHPRAFRTLSAVELLTLSGNDIADASMVVLAARELRELKTFDISHNRITELSKGTFVDMPTVEEINLSFNLISKIEHGAFFRLPALRTLDISGNKLHEFHADIFTESPSMEHLNVAKNNLSFVAEMIYISRALPNLKSLDVSENHLTSESFRSFGGHRKLESLKMDHNNLEKLSKGMFKDLPNLRELYLSYNLIKSDVGGQIWNLPKLRVLDLSHNDLEMVDILFLEGISQLSNLDLSFNVINNVGDDAFLRLLYLENLNMSFNSISKLPKKVFHGLGELFELELSFNELTALENEMFEGLSSLQYLHITHNQIQTIEEDVFMETPNLRLLDLSSNFIQHIPKKSLNRLTALIVLKLHQNVINEIQDGHLSGLRILEHLDLSRNHIQVINRTAFRDMSVLRDLDLSVNFIQSLYSDMFSGTKLLEKLNISHNYISDLGEKTFVDSRRLRILDITNNSLTELGNDVQGLLSLQGLFMGHNYISSLKNTTFHNLPNLSVLNFANNGLQTFEPGTFYNMESLVTLDLRNNNLVELNPDSFKALYALKELQVSKNQISVIKDFAFMDLTSLRSLELQDNVITEVGDLAFQNMPSLNFLNLSRNGLQDVPADALARLQSLDVLDLSWNYILEITDFSFHRLEWLTVLMLHDNDLCRLSDGAFAKQRALRVLTLNNNQLRRLHLQALGATIMALSLLDMSGNPFRCDCELVWLKEYLNEDPNDHRMPRTAILGENMRGLPVCASPPEYEGLPITEVPVEAFMCEKRLIQNTEADDVCVPRFLDPLLFTAGQQGGNTLDSGAVNTLLHLSNLSDTIPQGATGPSYLDVHNPILVHNLSALNQILSSSTEPSILEKSPVTAGVVHNTAETALTTASQNQEQLLSSSNIHTVTGDTPTIYAGSGAGGHVNDIKQESVTDTGLFSGFKFPTLPNIIESITNLNLPHIGLNMNWGNLPAIGRHESGVLKGFGPFPSDKPMKGPDENQPIWIDGPASPHPLFTAPPPPPEQQGPPMAPARGPSVAANSHGIIGLLAPNQVETSENQVPVKVSSPALSFPSGHGERLHPGIPGTVIPVGRPPNAWRSKPKPGQVEVIRPAQQDHSQNNRPNLIHRQRPSHSQASFNSQVSTAKPILPPVINKGPGPNAGKPFLPGLSTNQQGNAHHDQPIIVDQGTTDDSQDIYLFTGPGSVSENSGTFLTPPSSLDIFQGDHSTTRDEPQWSPPEAIHPDSGVSLYQPGEPFHPFQPDDPNHPITVVDAPNISISHRGTASPTVPITPSTFSISTSTHRSPADMSPSESQVAGGGNILLEAHNDVLQGSSSSVRPILLQDGTTTAIPPSSTVNVFGENNSRDSSTENSKQLEMAKTSLDIDHLKQNQASRDPTSTFVNQDQTDPGSPDQANPSLGDLLNLLYAAEEEAQKKDQESPNEESTFPDISQLPLGDSQNHPNFPPDLSTVPDFPIGPDVPPIISSTTETFPLTSSLITSTNSAATELVESFTESTTLSNKTHDLDSEMEPHPDNFPPQLGTGVTVLKDLPPDAFDDSRLSPLDNISDDSQPTNNENPPHVEPDFTRPYVDDINDSYQSPADHPNQDYDWPFSSENASSDSLSPTRYRPGFVVPVDKSGDPLPGTRNRPNNTYISPSKSVGRGGFPTIERVELPSHSESNDIKNVAVQEVDLAQDSGNGFTHLSQNEESIPNTEFEGSDVNAIDWYYSNYFREYDPYASLPVGGNKPPNSAKTLTDNVSILIGCLAGVWFTYMNI